MSLPRASHLLNEGNIEDKETSGKHLMEPCHDGNAEQMALMAKSSEEGESTGAEKCVATDSAPAAPVDTFREIIVVAVTVFCIIALSVIFADATRKCEPLHCPPPCPPDWLGFRRMCYFYSNEKRNWTSSQSFCSSQSASLLIYNSSLEKDFVMLLKGKASFWIGLRREPNQPWKWTNGENSTLKIIGEGHCVYLDNKAIPISVGCHTELFWICQKAEAKLDKKE